MKKRKLKIIRVTTKPISLRTLLKNQLKFINKFHQVIGISSPGKELAEVKNYEGIKTISINMTRRISPLKDIISLIKMIVAFRRISPDVVHSHTPKAGIICMLASFICRIPHRLHTVAGLPLMEEKGFKRILLLFVEWLTYLCATNIYPNSKGLKKFIIKNINVSFDKIKVIGNGSSNGVDTKFFNTSKKINISASVIKKRFYLERTFNFIFIGRIVKDKGVEELLKAFTKLNDKFFKTRLLILGYQEEKLDPISNISKKTIRTNKNIINLGYKKDIRPYIAASNCLILPSYREGFPNVVLQAGSMCVPSIVSNINGCNEIIKNGINGLLIKPKSVKSLYNSMEKILLNKKLIKSMIKPSREIIKKKFSMDTFHQSILEEYSKINNKKS